MRCAAVILAGGSGKRMGTAVPKQYMEISGKPVLSYSLKTFSESELVDEIIVVAGEGYVEKVQNDIVDLYGFHKVSSVIKGGAERYHSVARGLEALSDKTDYVFIHDGARPFVSAHTIERCLHYAVKFRASVAAVPSKDTVKIADDDSMIQQTPDRAHVWLVQTPQTFEYLMIRDAYRRLGDDEDRLRAAGIAVTDDTMVAKMYADVDARLVESSYDNIKITTPEDIQTAEMICGRIFGDDKGGIT